MDAASLHAINDIETSRGLLNEQMALNALQSVQITQRDEIIRERDPTLTYRQAKIDTLTAEIARLKRWPFGRRAESMDPADDCMQEVQQRRSSCRTCVIRGSGRRSHCSDRD